MLLLAKKKHGANVGCSIAGAGVLQKRRKRKTRRKETASSLLAAYFCCSSSSRGMRSAEAFSSSGGRMSGPARSLLEGWSRPNSALLSAVENDTDVLTGLSSAASSGTLLSHGYNAYEYESSMASELSSLQQLQGWLPEEHEHLATVPSSNGYHLSSKETDFGFGHDNFEVSPYYAERITSSISVSGTNGFKTIGKPSSGGPSPNPSDPVDEVELMETGDTVTETDPEDLDVLFLSDSLEDHSEEETEASESATLDEEILEELLFTVSNRPPSRRQRAWKVARNVWGKVSPSKLFRSAPEGNLDEDKPLNASLTPEEQKAKRQQSREAALVARMSRRKKKQLSNLLKSVNRRNTQKMAGMTSRTLTGLINALAEEADGLSVRMDAREETPFWRKQIDTVSIEFTRLGFKPLHMGGPDQQLVSLQEEIEARTNQSLPESNYSVPAASLAADTRQLLSTQTEVDDDDDSCPVEITVGDDGVPIAEVSCADTAFQQIDVDNSGALDKDEIADALVIAASSDNDISATASEGSQKLIKRLAKQLVDLYDANDDGVIDRYEYQTMVEDMAALRSLNKEKELKREGKENGDDESSSSWWNIFRGKDAADKEENSLVDFANATNGDELFSIAETALQSEEPETTGKIVLENLKIDLRQLVFGALPVFKHVTPGGPLFLEPLKVTITGSFSAEDIMKSSLLDAGLRQLVSFALRVRVRSFRDLVDGAVFYGRKWKRGSAKAPLVECTELTSVEIDDKDRIIITGRAKVRATVDAPVIDNSFKLRTKIATPRNGRAIKLSEPEIAIVLECPTKWERNINEAFAKMKLRPPPKPKPIYTYIPIHSPFKKDDDTGGYYMGEDNQIKSLCIKGKCLRFEMETILRPGKFLGSHYLAFTVPQRALIITVDRVKEGMKAARRRKKALKALQKARAEETDKKAHHAEDALALDDLDIKVESESKNNAYSSISEPAADEPFDDNDSTEAPTKGFISRFVDGYVQAGVAEESKEKLATAISDWFGRQGLSDSKTDRVANSAAGIESPRAGNDISNIVEDIAFEQIRDDDDLTQQR